MAFGDDVKAAREARGLSQDELAQMVGATQSTIDRIERGESQRSRYAPEVAMALEIPFNLRTGNKIVEFNPAASGPPAPEPTDMIPVYPAVEGGPGALLIARDPIEFMRRPQTLDGIGGAYAVYITGESMVPEYEPGDRGAVHPTLPPVPGATCVFYTNDPTDDRATIKRLVGITVDEWHVRQWNPDKEFSLDRVEWPVCHRVVGREPRR